MHITAARPKPIEFCATDSMDLVTGDVTIWLSARCPPHLLATSGHHVLFVLAFEMVPCSIRSIDV